MSIDNLGRPFEVHAERRDAAVVVEFLGELDLWGHDKAAATLAEAVTDGARVPFTNGESAPSTAGTTPSCSTRSPRTPSGRWRNGSRTCRTGSATTTTSLCLRMTILAAPGDFGGRASDEAIALIHAARADLQDRCWRLGARLYAEPPRAFGQRVGRYWKAWHALGRERPVGEISDLAREPADRPPVARELLVDGALR